MTEVGVPTIRVPPPGGRITVRVDDALSDDLATLAAAGLGTSDAVRQAVALLAGACRAAWDAGYVPESRLPTITGVRMDDERPSDTGGTAV